MSGQRVTIILITVIFLILSLYPPPNGACLQVYNGNQFVSVASCPPGSHAEWVTDTSCCCINCNTQHCSPCCQYPLCLVYATNACPGAPKCQGCGLNEEVIVNGIKGSKEEGLTKCYRIYVGCMAKKNLNHQKNNG